MARITARRFGSIALVTVLVVAGLPASAFAFAKPPVTVPAYTLTTDTDLRLVSRASTKRREVASTIKMLNALVVRERTSLDEVVTVPKTAAAINDGDVGLKTGQKLTVRQLLEMMLVASANDAAEALAIHIGGSEKAYVALMNNKAKQLGLADTKATDPHGLGENEHSTAHDLAILARNVTADPVLAKIVKKCSVKVPRTSGKKAATFRTTNHLLGVNGVKRYKGIEGVKTGYTSEAGWCLVSAATRTNAKGERVRLVGVVMGAKRNNGKSGRFDQMRKLLDWGFKHTHVKTLASTETTYPVPCTVSANAAKLVVARPETQLRTALLDGTKITHTVVPAAVTFPVAKGDKVGELQVEANGKKIRTVSLIASDDVSASAMKMPLP